MTPTNPAAYLGLYAAFTGRLPPINLYNIGPILAEARGLQSTTLVKFADRTHAIKTMKDIYARH